MSQLIGLCGSLRKASHNLALLRAASQMMPDGWTLDLATLDGVPLYNADLESQQGVPAAVTALKDRIAAAAGLVIATPEYNNSLPGVLKNGIDWLSRPPQDIPRVFHNQAVLVIGATPGGMGTALAQSAWLPVLRALRTRPWFGGPLQVAGANQIFDESGELTDEDLRKRIVSCLAGFCEFAGGAGR